MNNKPIKQEPYGYVMEFESGVVAFNRKEYELKDDKRISSLPLFTHPKELSLTDEDKQNALEEWKKELIEKNHLFIVHPFQAFKAGMDSALAILRKAQEK